MNFKKLFCFLLIITILTLNIPFTAFADDASGTVGETEASISMPNNSPKNTETSIQTEPDSTADAKASAASSTVGGTEGNVSESAPPSDSNPTTASNTNTETNNGNNSKTTMDSYETSAYAGDNTNGKKVAEAKENVNSVEISAPDGATSKDNQPLKNIVTAEKSEGTSVANEDSCDCDYFTYSKHEMTNVSLFDNAIKFDSGRTLSSSVKQADNKYDAEATAEIKGLHVWNPTTKTYVDFGDYSNDADNPTDHSASLNNINDILALSNIQITTFLSVYANSNNKQGPSNSSAKLLEAILTSGLSSYTVSLGDVSSNANETKATSSGKEISFKAVTQTVTQKEETKKEAPEIPLSTPAAESSQVQSQPVQEQSTPSKNIKETSSKSETPTSSNEVFPATGLKSTSSQNVHILFMLFVIAFLMLGTKLSFFGSAKNHTN